MITVLLKPQVLPAAVLLPACPHRAERSGSGYPFSLLDPPEV